MSWPPGASPDYLHDETVCRVVAAADSSAKSIVPDAAGFVYVTAYTTDANDWIVLPPLKVGRIIRGYSAVGHEIRTPASSNEKINDVDSDGSQEAAITATWSWLAEGTPNGWVLTTKTKLGVAGLALVPD